MTQRVDRSPHTCAELHAFGRIGQWIRACNLSTISMRWWKRMPQMTLRAASRSFGTTRSLDILYDAIRKLPPIFRDVLILVELQEMSYADAAAVTGIELGTVRSRLSRAKARLAQLLNTQVE